MTIESLRRWGARGLCGIVLVVVAACQPEGAGTAEQADAGPAVDSAAVVASRTEVRIDNALAGWIGSGLSVAPGDHVTLFGHGTIEADGLEFEPRHALWYRIGEDGPATNFAANHETFVAEAGGEVFVALRPVGIYWTDRRGTFPEGVTDAPPVPVTLTVDVVRFDRDAEAALSVLADAGDADAAAALKMIAERKTLPAGFEPLWNLARSNVWASGVGDGRPGLTAATSDDFGIVRKVVDVPLTAATELDFSWRYDALPALGPETEAANHDYLSVALEFDNGQDLTWFWSVSLPEGSHFGCPLPWWDSRETHMVLQSGEAGLGDWHSHTRRVLDDYTLAVSGEPPERIVGIWFIANSVFGRQPGAASFADVVIRDGETQVSAF
jgi:hypothetical protein